MDDNSTQNKSHFISNNYFVERSENEVYNESRNEGALGGEVSNDLGFGNLAAAKEYAEKISLYVEETPDESQNPQEE